jgi:hypothetical protein
VNTSTRWRWAALLFFLSAGQALAAEWEQVPGEASAIAIGANGEVWAVSGSLREPGGYAVYHWNGERFARVPGAAAVRIAVDPFGNPWVVDSFNNLVHWSGGAWQKVRGSAKDVGIGADGSVWTVGIEGGLYQYRAGNLEKRFPGNFVRVAVDSSGEPWPIDGTMTLMKRSDSGWQPLRPATMSVALGPSSMWVLDNSGATWRLDANGNWLHRRGRFKEIAVGPDGMPWTVTLDNRVFRRIPD